MCKYEMSRFKSHYACFDCKKTFKRRVLWDINRDDKRKIEAKCPQCGKLMANMGLDFASPKKDDIKGWTHIKKLYSVGITFHSCGCSGPGYIPNSNEKLIEYFEEIKRDYIKNLEFWRQRVEPTNSREEDRENSKYGNYLYKIPSALTPKKGAISNEAAKIYWIDKIKSVEQKLEKIK